MKRDNESIIEMHRQGLIEAGILGAGEMIHTYEGWKARGMMVKKGEKTLVRFPIWKMGKSIKTVDVNTDGGETVQKDIDTGRFFMKESCFFSSRQVQPAR